MAEVALIPPRIPRKLSLVGFFGGQDRDESWVPVCASGFPVSRAAWGLGGAR